MQLYLKDNSQIEYAKILSTRFQLELVSSYDNVPSDGMYLFLSENGLSLNQGNLSMLGDFQSMVPRLKANNLNSETIIKAAKYKGNKEFPSAIDATAGMGEDSLLLAAFGYNVLMFEANPIIASLLYDTLNRSKSDPVLKPIVERMNLINGDSITYLTDLGAKNDFTDFIDSTEGIDMILLDPMFPARNKSGLIKKKFQLLQQLEMPCSNEAELLMAAINSKPKKIIIKRPAKGPFLSDKKPDYSIKGKSIRYDCLVFPCN